MIDTERLYIKALRLAPPETTLINGIPAEKIPVFTSPSTYTCRECLYCGQEFTPLVYQVGRETQCQHFHQEKEVDFTRAGGIYFYGFQASREVLHFDFLKQNIDLRFFKFGWMAILQPIGRLVCGAGNLYRSESVEVKEVFAFDVRRKIKESLQQGFAVCNDDRFAIYPVSELDRGQKYKYPIYSFEKYGEEIGFRIEDSESLGLS